MANVERLRKRKKRLTARLTTIDNAALDARRDVPKATFLRARIYRVDLLLERAGAFSAPWWEFD